MCVKKSINQIDQRLLKGSNEKTDISDFHIFCQQPLWERRGGNRTELESQKFFLLSRFSNKLLPHIYKEVFIKKKKNARLYLYLCFYANLNKCFNVHLGT